MVGYDGDGNGDRVRDGVGYGDGVENGGSVGHPKSIRAESQILLCSSATPVGSIAWAAGSVPAGNTLILVPLAHRCA